MRVNLHNKGFRSNMELPNRLLLNAFEDDAVLKIADKFLGEHLGKKDSTRN